MRSEADLYLTLILYLRQGFACWSETGGSYIPQAGPKNAVQLRLEFGLQCHRLLTFSTPPCLFLSRPLSSCRRLASVRFLAGQLSTLSLFHVRTFMVCFP